MLSGQQVENKLPSFTPDGNLFNWNLEPKAYIYRGLSFDMEKSFDIEKSFEIFPPEGSRSPSPEIEKSFQDPPPDGGVLAWLQVFGGWLLVVNTRYK